MSDIIFNIPSTCSCNIRVNPKPFNKRRSNGYCYGNIKVLHKSSNSMIITSITNYYPASWCRKQEIKCAMHSGMSGFADAVTSCITLSATKSVSTLFHAAGISRYMTFGIGCTPSVNLPKFYSVIYLHVINVTVIVGNSCVPCYIYIILYIYIICVCAVSYTHLTLPTTAEV